MIYDYDLFVIGAGSGGVRAARMSAKYGARVAIAETRYLGGTCVNVGCVPKKLFAYAAHFSEHLENARAFGWHYGTKRFDWQTLITNKNAEIKRLNAIYENLLKSATVHIMPESATIVDAHTVEINHRRVTTERILVATGSWPKLPDLPGQEHIITSNEAFFLEPLPKQIIIVGGGYIAIEFAGIFNGLGVETTLLYRGQLFLRDFDLDAREFLAEEMRKKGITLKFETNIKAIEKSGNKLQATLTDTTIQSTERIMYATGRKPNTANLGLEELGIKLDRNGAIVVNQNYQTTVPSIYAIGDVTNRVNLTPVALAEGAYLARKLYNNQYLPVDYTNIPTCIFSQPNLATVGLTEATASTKYAKITVYKTSFTALQHTLSGSQEKTFIKLIVDQASDRVVGAHMVGEAASEIIQGIAIAIKTGATKADFDQTIGIHPTVAEEFVTLREPENRT